MKSDKAHVVMFSGGIGSWAAAKRVAERYGTDNLYLLFTDTKTEDEDTYRFLNDAARNIGAPIEWVQDGRDIWQIFIDERYMGNSRIDVCSKNLKRLMADSWIKQRFSPDEVICYVGIDWTEEHRYTRLAERKKPYVYEAPLCEEPLLTKAELHKWAESEGIRQQRLYEMGMPHANCGGGCVKAGQAHFRQLWQQFPERYMEWERNEQRVYEEVPSARPFLRVTENKELRYITLREFRERYLEAEQETGETQIDLFDFGGCGCFSDAPEESAS